MGFQAANHIASINDTLTEKPLRMVFVIYCCDDIPAAVLAYWPSHFA